jgi:uncharacterized protein (TIGR02246 family)
LRAAGRTHFNALSGWIETNSSPPNPGRVKTLWQGKCTRKTGEVNVTPESSKLTEETRIRQVIDRWAEAVRARDSAGLVSNFAPDALLFDLINPLQYVGADALKNRAEQWLSSFEGPIGYQTRDLRITAGDDVAFCHSLNRVNGTTRDGKKIDMWWRATVCFRKIDGDWMVTHEHSSEPFDMKSGRASLDLKP